MRESLVKPARQIFWMSCVLALSASASYAADEQDDDGGRQCINASIIRQTKIIDDSSILFYVRGSIYRNILPRQCHGLLREGRFSYRRSSANLCRSDFIQILYPSAGGLREGRMCALGNFYEVTKEDVEFLLNPPPQTPQTAPDLPPSEPEEIIEDSNEP
jgi:hypothetical protein